LRKLCVDAHEVVCGEADIDRGGILLEVGAPLRARIGTMSSPWASSRDR
jgi:hypothetical protein